jgi:CubicO group peptidase (beta-lactamase class C family)
MVHQLLTHTSGLGDYREGALLLPRGQPLRELADYKPVTVADRPAFEPGTRHRESTTGYLLLGAIVETVSARPYAEVLRESVHGPAMMIDTGMFSVEDIAGPRARGYDPIAPPGSRSRRRSWRSNVAKIGWCGTPAGGGWSNVDDLLSFTLRLQQHRLLSEEMTGRLLTPQPDPSGSGRGLAYGFEVVPSPGGGRAWRHVGEWPGASAVLEFHEERGYVFVALSNETAGTDVVRDLLHHLLASAQATKGR